jgi:hypothetical protein
VMTTLDNISLNRQAVLDVLEYSSKWNTEMELEKKNEIIIPPIGKCV